VSTSKTLTRKQKIYNRWRTSLNIQWLLLLALAVAALIVKKYQPAFFYQFALVFLYTLITLFLKEIFLHRNILYFHRFPWFFAFLNVSVVFALYTLGYFPLNFLFVLYILLIYDSIAGFSRKELRLTVILASLAFLVNIITLWPHGAEVYLQAGLSHLYILQGIGIFLSLFFIILASLTALFRSRQAEDLIQNLEQLLHEKERNLKQLYEVNAALEEKYAASYTLSLIQQYLLHEMQDPKLLEKITDIIQGVSGSSVCAILSLEDDFQEADEPAARNLQLLAVSGAKDPSSLIRLFGDPESLAYRVLDGKKPSNEKEATAKERALWNRLGIKSFFLIPLFTKEEEIGLMFVAHSQEGAFNRDQLEFLQLIANQLSLALENILLHQKTQKLAWHDPLTGLCNRYYLNHYLATQEEKLGSTLTLGCIIFDLDHFKQVNDQYGHVTGDKVLKKVGAIIRKHAEAEEGWLPGRFGGEEFILIATGNGDHGCEPSRLKKVAENIRKQIEQTTFTSRDGKTFSLTISGGIACIPQQAKNTDEMIIKADEALYRAKGAGRNRVVIYS
jgi:diguanylate cyclase (GGDEF)-like protein